MKGTITHRFIVALLVSGAGVLSYSGLLLYALITSPLSLLATLRYDGRQDFPAYLHVASGAHNPATPPRDSVLLPQAQVTLAQSYIIIR